MADEVEFTVDASSHTIDSKVITEQEWDKFPTRPNEDKVKTDTESKPLTRATAAKSMGAGIGMVHWIGARVLDEPALELDKDEKKVYGEAGVDLLKAYGVDFSTHPKVAAWLSFSTVALEIDGPRVVLILTSPPKKRYNEAEEGEVPPLVYPERPS